MSKFRHKGDFDEIDADYPECTEFVTSDVTLDIQGGPPAQVNATIEYYGATPNGETRYLLTVWDPNVNKPIPKPRVLKLGKDQVGIPPDKTSRKKPKK